MRHKLGAFLFFFSFAKQYFVWQLHCRELMELSIKKQQAIVFCMILDVPSNVMIFKFPFDSQWKFFDFHINFAVFDGVYFYK